MSWSDFLTMVELIIIALCICLSHLSLLLFPTRAKVWYLLGLSQWVESCVICWILMRLRLCHCAFFLAKFAFWSAALALTSIGIWWKPCRLVCLWQSWCSFLHLLTLVRLCGKLLISELLLTHRHHAILGSSFLEHLSVALILMLVLHYFNTRFTLRWLSLDNLEVCFLISLSIVHRLLSVRCASTLIVDLTVSSTIRTIILGLILEFLYPSLGCQFDQFFLVNTLMLLTLAKRIRCLINKQFWRVPW